MITSVTGDRVFEYRGLSTDTKPQNDGVGNGSSFLEMDTAKVFMYDIDKYKAGEDPWIELD